MTSLTDTQVVTASGGLVELGYFPTNSYGYISVTQTAAATGTIICEGSVVCDGSPIMVEFSAANVTPSQTAGDHITFSLELDGAIESTYWGIIYSQAANFAYQPVFVQRRISPAAGTHNFKVRAWVTNSGRAGTVFSQVGGVGNAAPAFLRVSKIVQATQWPAVTTGTIICTSSTRPASPFEGQVIYETDTGLTRYYDGAAWEDTAAATRPYHAEVYLASNISYPRATNLEWTHLREDNTGGAWAASPNPERLVFPADGMYLCVANMRWDVGSGNDSTQTSMSVVGGLGTVTNVGYAVNGTSVSEILTTVAVVSAGDYLQVSCFNKPTGGSPFTCVASSFMSFTQLSAVPT